MEGIAVNNGVAGSANNFMTFQNESKVTMYI
jgi:hypothetical protein